MKKIYVSISFKELFIKCKSYNYWSRNLFSGKIVVSLATAKIQMRIGNKFVEPAKESPLAALDRTVYLAKNS